MKRSCIALLAHVDAGKTTLSEGILYRSGAIKNLGRVDKRDSFLDNYALERSRGITIFSKQAVFEYEGTSFTLLDTPGHVDFSAEAERTLPVLDAAILVISGPEGLQAHTRTLWRLLKSLSVPVFIFVNKCDREVNRDGIFAAVRKELSGSVVDFSGFLSDTEKRVKTLEDIATCEISVLDDYLENNDISDEEIRRLIAGRKVFPLVYGSALKLDGVDELLKLLARFVPGCDTDEGGASDSDLSAKVFKIGRDKNGSRLTYMKIISGILKPRDDISYDVKPGNAAGSDSDEEITGAVFSGKISEKVTQLRVYSSEKYESVDIAYPGMIVAALGLSATYAGQLIGCAEKSYVPELIPVMEYRVVENDKTTLLNILQKLKILEEEEPSLDIHWDDGLKELRVRIMGDIQLEILKCQLKERFGLDVIFDTGSVLYKETVSAPVIGVGHFEPLRHYAEVHLLIEPLEPGSGIEVASMVSVNDLALNWQRLIITHILEKEHKGVLTGAALTDVRITIVAGRAHLKHTEGGDFRQATYRAIRQGLMKAGTRLLEPYLNFSLTIPSGDIGRAMTDIEMMSGKVTEHEDDLSGMVVINGIAPAATITGYTRKVTAYSKGLGSISLSYGGYYPCHNESEIAQKSGYDPLADLKNPSSSVFCAHGAGFTVDYDEVDSYKHIDLKMDISEDGEISVSEPFDTDEGCAAGAYMAPHDTAIGTEEIDSIILRSAFNNRKEGIKNPYRKLKKTESPVVKASTPELRRKAEAKEKYLLVDGYNIIFSWEELKTLAGKNLDGARERLNDILCNYRAMIGSELIVVYDAYRVEGHREEFYVRDNIKVVFTKQAETADRYIERFSHENASRYDISVATSDGLEQIIIRGAGCRLITASDLYHEINAGNNELRERYLSGPSARGALIGEIIEKKNSRQ